MLIRMRKSFNKKLNYTADKLKNSIKDKIEEQIKFENLIRQLNNEHEIELNNFHDIKEQELNHLNNKVNELLTLLNNAE